MPRVRLEAVELYRCDPALRAPIGTAAGAHTSRPVAFVRVVTDAGDGWGECPAIAGGTPVDAPFEVVWDAIASGGVDRLWAATRARDGVLPLAAQVPVLYGEGTTGAALAATFGMAALDAELRADKEPLWRRLGVSEAEAASGAPVGHVVGIPFDRSLDTLLGAIAGVADRAARVRLKIEPGWDAVPVRAVRSAFPGLALQVDANGSYRIGTGDTGDPADVSRLRALDAAGLTCIEQPLPPGDLVALADVARMLDTPVCLDESLSSLRRLTDALRYGACDVACIKPARFGGLLGARRAQHVCAEAGVPAFVGGFFESGFARRANVALSGLAGFTLPGDLSDPGGYLDPDPVEYPSDASGRVVAYEEPGIAPAPSLGEPVHRWAAARPE